MFSARFPGSAWQTKSQLVPFARSAFANVRHLIRWPAPISTDESTRNATLMVSARQSTLRTPPKPRNLPASRTFPRPNGFECDFGTYPVLRGIYVQHTVSRQH